MRIHKILVAALSLCVLCGCITHTDATKESPHHNLVGTWQLQVDTYLIRYDDQRSKVYAIACDSSQAGLLPNRDATFSEDRIGNHGNDVTIIGSLKKGSLIEITEVIRESHPTIGISYLPISAPVSNEGKTVRINFDWFYQDSDERLGALNPKWATKQ